MRVGDSSRRNEEIVKNLESHLSMRLLLSLLSLLLLFLLFFGHNDRGRYGTIRGNMILKLDATSYITMIITMICMKGAIPHCSISSLRRELSLNTCAAVARAQSCANHVQHIGCSSCRVPLGTEEKLSC